MAKNPLERLKKSIGNGAVIMSDDNNPYTYDEFFDTGIPVLNCMFSDGDIYKGIFLGKRVGIAGPSSTGKSYFTINLMKKFIEKDDHSYVILFETEGTSVVDICKDMKIDLAKILIQPCQTVEEFRTNCLHALDDIKEQRDEAKKNKTVPPNYMICLDSLGNLPTNKEIKDAREENDKVDMTRAKIIKSVFRIITAPLSLTKTPLIVVNHSYATLDLYSRQVSGGGSGYTYAVDQSIILSKAQMKEGENRSGAIITCSVEKSRFMREGSKFKVYISFKDGILPFSNMLDFAEEFGIVNKEGHSFVFKDGAKVKMKEVAKNMGKYFTKEIMDDLQVKIKNKYSFGSEDSLEIDTEEEE